MPPRPFATYTTQVNAVSDSNFLPEGVFDYLPPDAEQMEHLRRQVVDTFHSWGYRMIIPPMIEFLSTLVHGTSADLERDTFKLTDQISGRLIGIRSDITPQATRIDANFNRGDLNRFCYVGATLTTLPKGADRTRMPIQVGAEIFGAASPLAEAEVLLLVHELFERLGVSDYRLELSDARILDKLCTAAGLTTDQIELVSAALATKSVDGLSSLTAELVEDPTHREWFQVLLELNGPIAEVLRIARSRLPLQVVGQELAQMEAIVARVEPILPPARLACDYAEAAGYHYYTGISFAVYASGHCQDLARGGRYRLNTRYSNVANREAVGFSSDLQTLNRLAGPPTSPPPATSEVPTDFGDPEAYRETQRRRRNGEQLRYRLD